jgi:hypothetical protein
MPAGRVGLLGQLYDIARGVLEVGPKGESHRDNAMGFSVEAPQTPARVNVTCVRRWATFFWAASLAQVYPELADALADG